jgi:hypothetical protein
MNFSNSSFLMISPCQTCERDHTKKYMNGPGGHIGFSRMALSVGLRSLAVLLFISLFLPKLISQDTLVLNDQTNILVNILSLENDTIDFLDLTGVENEVRHLAVDRIDKIHFSDGRMLDFTENDMDTHFSEVVFSSGTVAERNENPDFRMKIGLGLMLGTSISTLDYSFQDEPVDMFNQYRYGPAGGFFLEWEISRFFSLRTSFIYLDKGDHTNGESYISNWEYTLDDPVVHTGEGNGYIKKQMGYIEGSFLPLFGLTRKRNNSQLQLGAGVYLSYGILGNEEVDLYVKHFEDGKPTGFEFIYENNPVVFTPEDQPENITYTTFRQLDYGLAFYLGVKPRPFVFSTTLSWGKSNIQLPSIKQLPYTDKLFDQTRNISLSLLFGIYL